MTIGINTPLCQARRHRRSLPAPSNAPLEVERGNVAIRVATTKRPMRRGLGGGTQFAVLVEMMRAIRAHRGQPQVVTRDRQRKATSRWSGVGSCDYGCTGRRQLLGARARAPSRDGQPRHGLGPPGLPGAGAGAHRLPDRVPDRHTWDGILHHVFDGWEPWHGDLRTRRNGSMVADRRGVTTTFALMNLQGRGTLIVGPAEDVYRG